MLKMINACTTELDDIEQAVAEIHEQLDAHGDLFENSVGILTCYSEFIDTGVVKALCDSLPFHVIGGTSLANCIESEAGLMMLSLTVLTADDVYFSTALTAPLEDDMDQSIAEAYQTALSNLPSKPEMMVSFMPLLKDVGGEMILGKLDPITDGVPIFGTLVCDHFSDYSTSHTICDGEASKDQLAMLVISGNIKPRFMVATISNANIQKQTAIITDAQGCLLKSVNNMPAEEYMKRLGLVQGGGIESLNTIPFIVDYNDGTKPAARVIHMITLEGYAICGGEMPKGSTLSIGLLEAPDVLKTSEGLMENVLSLGECNGLLCFPCVSRGLIMGTDMLKELETIRKCLGNQIPFHASYSGGEYCPVQLENESFENRFHNFSIVACVL